MEHHGAAIVIIVNKCIILAAASIGLVFYNQFMGGLAVTISVFYTLRKWYIFEKNKHKNPKGE